MAVRNFNGSSDFSTHPAVGLAGVSLAAYTAIAVFKRMNDVNVTPLVQIVSNPTGVSFQQGIPWTILGTDVMQLNNPSANTSQSTGMTVLSTEGWLGLVVQKEAGLVPPTFRKYSFDTGAITSQAGAPNLPDGAAIDAAWTLQIGRDEFFNKTQGRWATLAIYGSVLDVVDIEAALDARSTQALFDLNPAALLDFNQAATSDPILDLTGNGADQASLTGTTVVTDDDPPGWTFGLAVATDDVFVRVGGAWVASDRVTRSGGTWI